jgi:hypothetical protein
MMYASNSISAVSRSQRSNNSLIPPKHQAGSFQNAVGKISSETYRDEEGYTTTYHSYTTSPLGQALSEQYTQSNHKNSYSERAAMMGRSYREATSRILITSLDDIPRTPISIAKNLLSQLQEEKASYKSQQVLQALSVLSLTQAGFNLHQSKNTQFSLTGKTKNKEEVPSAIGVTGGFNGKAKRLFGLLGKNDMTPKNIREHVHFLNTFKAEGLPTLQPAIAVGENRDEHAEQLAYHGTMLLICAPTDTMRQHPNLVKQLANAVNDLETTGKAGQSISDQQITKAQQIVEEARAIFLAA